MHEWIDSEISAILFALIVIVFVSLAFAHHMIVYSNQRSRKNHKFEIGLGSLIEREEQVEAYCKSMLVIQSTCVMCQNPTTRRCSRCKLMKYCSSECQVAHWKESHKNECRAPKEKGFEIEINKVKNMCNGNELKSFENEDSTIVLNPISLGFFKSYNKKIKKENKQLARRKMLLFPYKYFIKLFEWEGLNEPCGLINCGNSCFANVVLQCLTYTRPLTAYLLDGCHGQDCRRNDWCFMCELQNHVYKVKHSQNPFSPLRILSRIRNISNNLGYGRQEDAHEFMRFAIDSMQSICLDEIGGENMIDLPTEETTLIHHIFGGHLQSQVKCMQCKHESNRYESMMDLAVEIHGLVESLEDAMEQFTTIEILDGDNKYKCDICNAYVKAQKQLTVHEAPNVLTIALKRFQSGKFGKLNKRVTFPEVLDMSPYMSENQTKISLFKLYAVVVHLDMLNASFFGHYICYVKDSTGLWYKIDDNKVKEVELEKVLIQRAYMLFYSRSVVRKAPLIEGTPTTISTSCLNSKMTKNSCIESQRSLILPNLIGSHSIPPDFSKDILNEKIPLQLNLSKEKEFFYENDFKDPKHIVDKDVKNIEVQNGKKVPHVSISNIAYDEAIAKESSSSNNFMPLTNSTTYRTSNESFASKALNCNFSCNKNTMEHELPLSTNNKDSNINNMKSTHQCSSLPRYLDINQRKDLPLEEIDDFSLRNDFKNIKEILPIRKGSIDGVEDSLILNDALTHQSHPIVCISSNKFVDMERSCFNETNLWNDIDFERIKQQHIEGTMKKLNLSSTTSPNRKSHDLDIDNKDTSKMDKSMDLNKPLHTSCHSTSISLNLLKIDKSCDNLDILQLSNGALSSKGFPYSERILDKERCDLSSVPKIHEANFGHIDQKHETNALQDHTLIQRPCEEGNTFSDKDNLQPYNLITSQNNHELEFGSTYRFESFQEDSWIQHPYHECQIFIDELPPITINNKKEPLTTKVTQIGMEMYEESYDIRPLEEDATTTQALPIEPSTSQTKSSQQEESSCGSTKLCTTQMKNSNIECPNGEILKVVSTNIVGTLKEAQIKRDEFASHVELKKHAAKPLFNSGFLNQSSRPIFANSLYKNVVANGNGSSEENNLGELMKGGESLSNWRHTSNPIINSEECNNQRLKCCVTNNGICSNGIIEFKKSKEVTSNIGRKNVVSILT